MSEAWEAKRKKKISTEEARRREEASRFWDLKSRFSYYLVSLPFAVLGIAVASFPQEASMPLALALGEIISWLALGTSGAFGLWAKWAEKEQARLWAVSAAGQVARWKEARSEADIYTAAFSELSERNQERLRRAERLESVGSIWHKRLLITGIATWTFMRAALVVFGAL